MMSNMRFLPEKTILFAIGVVLLLPGFAHAAGLSVIFEQDPLFSDINVAPGMSVSRTAEVNNGNTSTESIEMEAINVTDANNFGDALTLTVTEGATTVYSSSLTGFFNNGQQALSSLAAGATTTYTFTMEFASTSANEFQNVTVGFDLCIGFEGGSVSCDGSSGGGSTPSGGGGGGGIITQTLQIFNEQDAAIPPTSGLITWDTNLPSSTQVVYGLKSAGPFTLNTTDPLYGYPLGTTEDFSLVTSHIATLNGLTPGEVYVYRVISRESPTSAPNISPEYELTVASAQPLALGAVSLNSERPASVTTGIGGDSETVILGGAANNLAATPTSTATTSPTVNNQVAAAFLGIPSEFWELFNSPMCILLFVLSLVLAYGAMRLIDWSRKWKDLSLHGRRVRRISTLISFVVLEMLVAFFFSQECLILPLGVTVVVLVVYALIHVVRVRRVNQVGSN